MSPDFVMSRSSMGGSASPGFSCCWSRSTTIARSSGWTCSMMDPPTMSSSDSKPIMVIAAVFAYTARPSICTTIPYGAASTRLRKRSSLSRRAARAVARSLTSSMMPTPPRKAPSGPTIASKSVRTGVTLSAVTDRYSPSNWPRPPAIASRTAAATRVSGRLSMLRPISFSRDDPMTETNVSLQAVMAPSTSKWRMPSGECSKIIRYLNSLSMSAVSAFFRSVMSERVPWMYAIAPLTTIGRAESRTQQYSPDFFLTRNSLTCVSPRMCRANDSAAIG